MRCWSKKQDGKVFMVGYFLGKTTQRKKLCIFLYTCMHLCVDKEGYTDTEKTYKDNYWDNCGLFYGRGKVILNQR